MSPSRTGKMDTVRFSSSKLSASTACSPVSLHSSSGYCSPPCNCAVVRSSLSGAAPHTMITLDDEDAFHHQPFDEIRSLLETGVRNLSAAARAWGNERKLAVHRAVCTARATCGQAVSRFKKQRRKSSKNGDGNQGVSVAKHLFAGAISSVISR